MRYIFWLACTAIFYTLFGYPLAVAVLARLAPRPWRRAPLTPSVSLVIAAYNEAEWIERKLQNTQALGYPRDRLQVLIAADGSDDATPELVRRASGSGVELVYQPGRQGKAAALNRAVERANGEILVFSDANAFYAPLALRHLVANFADPDVAVVTGAKTLATEHASFGRAETLYWTYEAWIRANESLVGQCTGANGEILAVRRTDWQPLPTDTVNDDLAIALNAMARGRRVVFEPEARATETSTAGARDEVARRQRMLAGRWQMLASLSRLLAPPRPLTLWQVASHKGARALLPFFATAALVSNLWLVLGRHSRSPAWAVERLVFAGQVLVALLVAARAAHLPLPGMARKVASVATYLAFSQYASLAGFITWRRGGQNPAWRKAARQSVAERTIG